MPAGRAGKVVRTLLQIGLPTFDFAASLHNPVKNAYQPLVPGNGGRPLKFSLSIFAIEGSSLI